MEKKTIRVEVGDAIRYDIHEAYDIGLLNGERLSGCLFTDNQSNHNGK